MDYKTLMKKICIKMQLDVGKAKDVTAIIPFSFADMISF